jgi:hypothetical protein
MLNNRALSGQQACVQAGPRIKQAQPFRESGSTCNRMRDSIPAGKVQLVLDQGLWVEIATRICQHKCPHFTICKMRVHQVADGRAQAMSEFLTEGPEEAGVRHHCDMLLWSSLQPLSKLASPSLHKCTTVEEESVQSYPAHSCNRCNDQGNSIQLPSCGLIVALSWR